MANEFADRRKRLLAAIGTDGIALIPAAREQIRNNDVHYRFRQNSDFYYLTGFKEPDALALFIPGHPDGEFVLFNRPKDPFHERWTGERVGQEGARRDYGADAAYSLDEIDIVVPRLLQQRERVFYSLAHDKLFDARLRDWLSQLRGEVRRGVNAPWEFIDLDHLLHEMRIIKSPGEIDLMRKAAEISAKAHVQAMKTCKPGMREYELQAEIDYVFQKHGCLTSAYDAIVGAGENSCVLHYTQNNDTLCDGDLVLIDAGVEFNYYASDITRTFPINGKFSREQAIIYQIVLDAQLAAISMLKPGITWQSIADMVIRVITTGLIDVGLLFGDVASNIESKAYQQFYMHNFGHWLGMDVHDVGAYKIQSAWRPLEVGMAFTVEPGIYISANSENVAEKWWNIGVRIEDDVVITETGCEVLSILPKTIADIESLMS